MNRSLYSLLGVLLVSLAGCRSRGPDVAAESLLPENENGNFVLYVSNQSSARTPVDIVIHIDGKKAVDRQFEVGNHHQWVSHRFQLARGTHRLVAVSTRGEARMATDFAIEAPKHWAVIDYCYRPEHDVHEQFVFEIRDTPMWFR